LETTTLSKLITANHPYFNIWTRQLSEHLTAQYQPSTYDEEEHQRIFFATNELLMGIARNFFTYGRFKDQWDTSKCSLHVFSQYLLLKSEKIDLEFQWGMDMNGFFIEANLTCTENLRYMTDDFWTAILALKDLGKFEYIGSGGLNAQEKPFFENKTSTIFQIIRRFMLYQMEQMMSPNTYQHSNLELGQFVIRWNFDTDWPTLLEKSCQSFKILYNLNYQLWKITDLANKKLNNY